MEYETCSDNNDYPMASQEILEKKIEKIGDQRLELEFVAGPLEHKGKPSENFYVLEINYTKYKKSYGLTLISGGWDSESCDACGNKATELVNKFCEEENFIIDFW